MMMMKLFNAIVCAGWTLLRLCVTIIIIPGVKGRHVGSSGRVVQHVGIHSGDDNDGLVEVMMWLGGGVVH